jgi:ATP-dependent DNA helicase
VSVADLQVLMYHGTPEHRAELRATRMQVPSASGAGSLRGKKGSRYIKTVPNTTATFPVIVTTYEICIRDRQYLSGLQWKVRNLSQQTDVSLSS